MVYNTGTNKGKKRNDTPTPIWLCDFIYTLLKDRNYKNILDCCSGDCRLTKNFSNSKIINYEIKEGKDFLLETNKIDCDLCIFNPPFSLDNGKKELAAETFLDKVIELCGDKIEIIMICPMGFRLNQTIRSKRLKKMKNIYPEISSIISLPVDTFENTNFHTEILCYNTQYLKAHYFV
tara:strand:- start:1118 stop:1651 length:534 start_codon:yes stop_codon:yes gene_type:complete